MSLGHYLPIFLAALAAFLIGAGLYSPLLFAKAWVRVHGYTEEALAAMRAKASKTYAAPLAGYRRTDRVHRESLIRQALRGSPERHRVPTGLPAGDGHHPRGLALNALSAGRPLTDLTFLSVLSVLSAPSLLSARPPRPAPSCPVRLPALPSSLPPAPVENHPAPRDVQ